MTIHRPVVVTATAVALMLGLTGCFANPIDQLIQGGIESGIESVIEQETGAEISIDGGGGASMPATFPSAIPVIDGNLVYAQTIEDSWLISLNVGSAAEAESGYQRILDAGFAETTALDYGELKSYGLESDTYGLLYSYQLNDDGTYYVSYTVTTKE